MWRQLFYVVSFISFTAIFLALPQHTAAYYFLPVVVVLFVVGIHDIVQTKKNILRNYPIVGHLRYWLLEIRPEIQQYFIENELSGRPYSNEQREVIYSRSRGESGYTPFGTVRDVYEAGFESLKHSMVPTEIHAEQLRVEVGGRTCRQPYLASRLNISAMSFGALSKNAILALNRGAKRGDFAHNTGEGGISPYHLQEEGDLIWQIGTGYFGCRQKQGGFDLGLFRDRAQLPSVKMIEIKLSQGAKPGHGGVLPARKVSAEIAKIRGLELGEDAISPPAHSTFSTPLGLLEWLQILREASGGKPVGLKLCIGARHEFLGVCKAMLATGILPDFITIDGAEGGTGAAPPEFSDFVGVPLRDALAFVASSLIGVGLKDQIRLIASGKIVYGFDMVTMMALGANICNVARAMLFSLGCIQSRRCESNTCPTGITTQDPRRQYALDVEEKSWRVKNFHEQTLSHFRELVGAMGVQHVEDLRMWHIYRRVNTSEMRSFAEIYQPLMHCELLSPKVPERFADYWYRARAEAFT